MYKENIVIKKSSAIEEAVYGLLEPLVAQAGMELVMVEYLGAPSGMVLRITIDKTGGVTLDDCADISRTVSDVLDVNDIIAESYNLEVSSPGINRPLVRKEDFNKYAGEKVLIKADPGVEGRKRFKGILKGLENGNVVVIVDSSEFQIPLEHISRARLDII